MMATLATNPTMSRTTPRTITTPPGRSACHPRQGDPHLDGLPGFDRIRRQLARCEVGRPLLAPRRRRAVALGLAGPAALLLGPGAQPGQEFLVVVGVGWHGARPGRSYSG